MAKPQKRCVFCDRTGLSKEHVWSEWTYQIVPKLKGGSHIKGLITGSPRGPKMLDALKPFQGSVNSIKLRVVCERHCNNGWMSDLEELAKPILTTLIRNEPKELSVDDQRIISRWIAMKIVVAEHARRDLVATETQDRREIMRGVVSDDRWQIWIGSHKSKKWHSGGYHRSASTLGRVNPATGIPEPHNNSLVKNTQAVTLGLGSLAFYAIYSRVDALGKLKFSGELGDALHQITPTKEVVRWPPQSFLTDRELNALTNSFDKFARKMKWKESPSQE